MPRCAGRLLAEVDGVHGGRLRGGGRDEAVLGVRLDVLDPVRNDVTASGPARRTVGPPPCPRLRPPVLTAATLGLTAAITATRTCGDGVVHALRRDPDRLLEGQVWRVITPVWVQTDRSWLVVVAVFVLCAAVGSVAEQIFTRRHWIVLYLLGVIVGHGIGEVLQPRQGGTSVAFAGVLGGLSAVALLRRTVPTPLRVEAVVLTLAAVFDTAIRDIHGAPLLVGLAVTAVVGVDRCVRRPHPGADPGAGPSTPPSIRDP